MSPKKEGGEEGCEEKAFKTDHTDVQICPAVGGLYDESQV